MRKPAVLDILDIGLGECLTTVYNWALFISSLQTCQTTMLKARKPSLQILQLACIIYWVEISRI